MLTGAGCRKCRHFLHPAYNLARSTGPLVGFFEPPAGSTVTAITSAFLMEFVIGVAVPFPSGWKSPLGLGTSPFITQIWHVRSSGTEGIFLATRMISFSCIEVTSAVAPCSAHDPLSSIVLLLRACAS